MRRRQLSARERARIRWVHHIAPGTRGATSLNTAAELEQLARARSSAELLAGDELADAYSNPARPRLPRHR